MSRKRLMVFWVCCGSLLGVYACFNAIYASALLPDGTVAEKSVSRTLTTRGAVVAVDDLRNPTTTTFGEIEKVAAELEGEAK